MVDDAREEYGSDDQGLMGLIALGQYAERHVVYSIVIDALLDAYEEQAGTDAEGDS